MRMTDETEATERKPSAMEYFILALIGKAGLTSLYAFQQRAGLQPGGIRSALERLESWHLIARGESTARRKRSISLTEEGKAFLENQWFRCLVDHPDAEGVLRAACVALLMGAPDCASMCLRDSANARSFMAKEKGIEAEHLQKTQKDPLSTYLWMRTLYEAQRRDAESKAFLQLSQLLEEKDQRDGQHSKGSV